MIARRWSARATRDNAPRYLQYFRESLTPQLRRLPGYRGATLLERQAGDVIEIEVITWWAAMDAIRAFAGDDPSIAVVTDEAHTLLLHGDPYVDHAEVAFDDRV